MRLNGPAWIWPVALALAFRVGLVVTLPSECSFTGDTADYASLAENVLAGHGFTTAQAPPYLPTFERPPAYPLLLVAVWLVVGKSWLAVALAQAALDSAVVYLLFDLGKRRFGAATGLWAAWLYAILPFAAGTSVQFMAESLSSFGFVFAVWAATRTEGSTRPWLWIAGSGLALGVSALARPYLVPVGAVVGVVVAAERWASTTPRSLGAAVRTLVLFGAMCAVPFAPWVARNAWAAKQYHQPFVAIQNYGSRPPYTAMYNAEFSRFMASYDEPFIWLDAFKPPVAPYLSAAEREEVARLWVEIERGNGAMSPEARAAFARITDERYRTAPLRLYLWRPISMGLKTWFSPRASTFRLAMGSNDAGLVSGSRIVVAVLFLLNASVTVLALIGMVAARKTLARGAILWAAPLSLTVLLVVIATRETRLTMPLFGMICVAAGVGATALRARISKAIQARRGSAVAERV